LALWSLVPSEWLYKACLRQAAEIDVLLLQRATHRFRDKAEERERKIAFLREQQPRLVARCDAPLYEPSKRLPSPQRLLPCPVCRYSPSDRPGCRHWCTAVLLNQEFLWNSSAKFNVAPLEFDLRWERELRLLSGRSTKGLDGATYSRQAHEKKIADADRGCGDHIELLDEVVNQRLREHFSKNTT
jgi:hypothetical protein